MHRNSNALAWQVKLNDERENAECSAGEGAPNGKKGFDKKIRQQVLAGERHARDNVNCSGTLQAWDCGLIEPCCAVHERGYWNEGILKFNPRRKVCKVFSKR